MTRAFDTWASSLRTRLALGSIAVVAVLAIAWAWTLYGPVTDAVVDQQRTHLRTIAQAGALVLAQADESPQTTAERLVARTELRVTVIGADGKVLADTEERPATMENHSGRPEVRSALAGDVGLDTRVSETQGVRRMYVAVPASVAGDRVALRVSESQDRIDAISADARRTGLALLAIALAAALVITYRWSSHAAEPVTRLARAADSMADGDLTSPIPAADGELGVLSEALVRLRDQIRGKIGELEAERATLRDALDGLPQAVLLVEGGSVVLSNSAAADAFGTPEATATPIPIEEASLPASLATEVSGLLERRVPSESEIGPDPLMRYYRVTTVPLASAGAPRTLVAIEDVTEVRRLDAVRRDFVANASHELKTPTSAIQLLAEAAETASADGDAEAAATFVSQMRAEADRMRRLVLDLLDLSRLESQPSAMSVTDVRASIDLAATAHGAAARAAGLEIVRDEASVAAEDVYAKIDATDLAVALDNLLSNAIAYTPAGTVTIRLSADGSAVRVDVVDTGIGIGNAHVDRVFERFYRVDAARTRDSGGTGLGLALVKHVVERAGGSVAIASVVGEGTTGSIVLPRAS